MKERVDYILLNTTMHTFYKKDKDIKEKMLQ